MSTQSLDWNTLTLCNCDGLWHLIHDKGAPKYLDEVVKAHLLATLEELKAELPTKFSPDGAGGWHVPTYKLAIDDFTELLDAEIAEIKAVKG